MEKTNFLSLDDKTPEQKEKTFNKLQRIQNLLKKESALKKLCKLKLSLFSILKYSYKTKR